MIVSCFGGDGRGASCLSVCLPYSKDDIVRVATLKRYAPMYEKVHKAWVFGGKWRPRNPTPEPSPLE
jgi:hypothetical protein